ncbi:unnamed protein product [Pedinophyceae sp. YPF-701]|nr:unnamed protein product [Pedinophyceae sp. YPF-701]
MGKRRGGAAGGRRDKVPKSSDLYELEEKENPEEKQKERFDDYVSDDDELPGGFEDEEIDEDEAFDTDDEERFGEFFGDQPPRKPRKSGAPTEEVDLLESDEGSEDESGSDVAWDEEDGELFAGWGDGDGDAGELKGGDKSDSEGAGASDSGADEDEELDDEGHERMITDVLGRDRVRRRRGGELQTEAQAEGEFSAPAGDATRVSVRDLLAGAAKDGAARPLADARKALDRMHAKGRKAVEAPLPGNIRDRLERQVGYESAKGTVDRWKHVVKANREAPTLDFRDASRGEVAKVASTAALVANFTPAAEGMEAEVAGLLKEAGADTARAVQEAEEVLALRALSVGDARERRDRLAKMRSLLFHHEMKLKRLAKIKSKGYHKRQNKAEKLKAIKAGLLDPESGEAADAGLTAEERERREMERIKERLTLRHRNTSKWAKRALRKGLDPGTKAAVQEQLRLGEELRRKAEGEGDAGSSEGGTETESEGEGENSAPQLRRGLPASVKAAALKALESGDAEEVGELGKKGLFSLPFMRRAMERKKAAVAETARGMLREYEAEQEALAEGRDIDEMEVAEPEVGGGRAGRFGFGGDGVGYGAGGLAARRGADAEEGAGVGPARGGFDAVGGSDSERDGEDSDEEEFLEEARARAKELRGGDDGAPQNARDASHDAPEAGRAGRKASKVAATAGPTVVEGQTRSNAVRGWLESQQAGTAPQATKPPALSEPPVAAAPKGAARGAGVRTIADITGTPAASSSLPRFAKCKKFRGAVDGYVFRKGKKGVGYYLDDGKFGTAKAAAARLREREDLAANAAGVTMAGVEPAEEHRIADAPGGAAAGAEPTRGVGDDAPMDEEGAGGVQAVDGGDARQRALIAEAFAGDDVAAEFAEAKRREAEEELPKIETPTVMPGWGMWSDQQREPAWMRRERDKAEKERADALRRRKDAKLEGVVVSEKWDKKASKLWTPSVPFPFTSREAYERSLRQPLGREYNTDAGFRNLTRPAVLKSTGVIIDPLKFSKPARKDEPAGTGVASSKGLESAGQKRRKPVKRPMGVKRARG